MRFENHEEIVNEIAYAIVDSVSGARIEASNVSVSKYVEFYDSQDELRRIRISDHAVPRSCGDMDLVIDIRELAIVTLYDECGEYAGVEVLRPWIITEMIADTIKECEAW